MSFFLSFDDVREYFGGVIFHPHYKNDPIEQSEFLPIAEAYLKLARPAIGFFDDDSADPALCLGGDPALPAEMSWPAGPYGNQMKFVGEVQLSELPQVENLPASRGSLLFFADLYSSPEILFEACGTCVYVPPDIERVLRPHPPTASGDFEQVWRDEERSFRPRAGWMLPSGTGADAENLVDDLRGQIAVEAISEHVFRTSLARFGSMQAHLLGWAEGCQQPIEDYLAEARPGERWRSLFCLGDEVGVGQWFIEEEALADRDFSHCFFEWDCS